MFSCEHQWVNSPLSTKPNDPVPRSFLIPSSWQLSLTVTEYSKYFSMCILFAGIISRHLKFFRRHLKWNIVSPLVRHGLNWDAGWHSESVIRLHLGIRRAVWSHWGLGTWVLGPIGCWEQSLQSENCGSSKAQELCWIGISGSELGSLIPFFIIMFSFGASSLTYFSLIMMIICVLRRSSSGWGWWARSSTVWVPFGNEAPRLCPGP